MFTSPASTSTASSGDNWFRSFMSSVALGLRDSFIWPGSGGGSLASAGISQFGNLRTARAGPSAVTGGYGNGFLLLNTNHISLHHIGSTQTSLLAHSGMLDHDGGVGTTPYRSKWLTQASMSSISSTVLGTSGTTTFTFPTAYAVAPPFVTLSVQIDPGGVGYWFNVASVTTVGFSSTYSRLSSAGSVAGNVLWLSDGTVLG